jgi:hypothetical protein
MAKSIGITIVQSRLDYANSLYFGTSKVDIRKLQHIQNALGLVHIAVGLPLAASSSELQYYINWLPVYHRINFNIALLTSKILSLYQPSYLSSFIKFNIAP